MHKSTGDHVRSFIPRALVLFWVWQWENKLSFFFCYISLSISVVRANEKYLLVQLAWLFEKFFLRQYNVGFKTRQIQSYFWKLILHKRSLAFREIAVVFFSNTLRGQAKNIYDHSKSIWEDKKNPWVRIQSTKHNLLCKNICWSLNKTQWLKSLNCRCQC